MTTVPIRVKTLAALTTAPLALLTACGSTQPQSSGADYARRGVAAPVVPVGSTITDPGHGSMTLSKVTCGLKKVGYAPSKGATRTVRAVDGNQICVMDATFTNTESTRLSPAPFGHLLTSAGAAYPEDTNLATMASVYAPSHPSTSKISPPVPPGQSVNFRAYFQIPTTTKAASIGWPSTAGAPRLFALG